MNIKKFGYDMLPVLAGVLIALFINNFQESRRDRAFVDKIIENIISENQLNIEKIGEVKDKQKRTIDTLRYYRKNPDVTVFDCIRKVNGLSTPDIHTNAGQFLLSSGQTMVNVDLLMELSAIHQEVENFEIGQREIITTLYDKLTSSDEASKEVIMLILYDILNYEVNIDSMSAEFNEKYD
ncbi:MAG: hypothetical protein JXQ90_17720 [Cyclobacteriaceae bacterium]